MTSPPTTEKNPHHGHALVRHMGLFSLVVYGVGDMVGSGIYATVGKAAGEMGNAVWLAFVVSMVAALLTGLSYASIASRYPRAAGAAFVTHHAFRRSFLSYGVGLAVAASGLTSMAASSNAFAKTLAELAGFGPVLMWVLIFLGVLTVVNFWGIRESMWANLVCTLVEVGGLLFIIVVGARYWGSISYFETPPAPSGEATGLRPMMLFSGAVLTFFAFVGFEDMLNVSEEVKEPERTMPWGIVFALLTATVLYIGVAVTAVSVVHYTTLSKAPAPLAEITRVAASWLPPWVFKFITLFAVANTVLINYIMGSRLLYGMSKQQLLPRVLARVHHARRTPHVAIGVLLVLVLVLVVAGGEEAVRELGAATGLLLLGCFMVVNAALIVLKRRPGEPPGRFEVPVVIPALGILINGALIFARFRELGLRSRAPVIAGAIGLMIAVLYLIMRPKALTEEQLVAAKAEAEA